MYKLPNELIENIAYKLCVYDYSNISKYLLINKILNKYITYYLDKFNNTNETIYMATKIKDWRPEMDQIEYIYDSFILYDNINSYQLWNNKTLCKNTNMCCETKEILKCNLYKFNTFSLLYYNEDNDINTYKKIINPNNLYKKNPTFIDPVYFENEINVMNKLNFDIYFIYYFTENLNTCFGISFLILPYLDNRITKLSDFHSYNIVKKNIIHNHNITKVGSLDF